MPPELDREFPWAPIKLLLVAGRQGLEYLWVPTKPRLAGQLDLEFHWEPKKVLPSSLPGLAFQWVVTKVQ
jgi:hypothetical protein